MGSRVRLSFRLPIYNPAGRVTVSYYCGTVTVQANPRCSKYGFEASGWLFLWEKLSVIDTLKSKLYLTILWQRDLGQYLPNS